MTIAMPRGFFFGDLVPDEGANHKEKAENP